MTLRSVVRVLLSCVLHSVEFLSHLHLDSFAKYKTCAKIVHLFMRGPPLYIQSGLCGWCLPD